MPKVSVVLPTFNGSKYLKESVDSILSQTYADWELIIVDDGSTDETGEIADCYSRNDSRIRVIHNVKNEKLPRALNIGFAAARGQYLTWTSDDNIYMPDAFAVMADYLEAHDDAYMVRGMMDFIDETGRVIGRGESYDDRKIYSNNCVRACFMYKREVYEKVGGYDENTFCVEDYDYWLRVLDSFGKIVPIDKVLYRYRVHGGSLSATRQIQVRKQLAKLRLRYLDHIFDALGDKNELRSIYYEIIKSGCMTREASEKFKRKLPALCGEIDASDKRYIIFGAGKYGERAAGQLGSRAAFFVDNDPGKTGMVKCGLKILAFDEAVKIADDYCFLIAVAGKSYDIAEQLYDAGIREYVVFV